MAAWTVPGYTETSVLGTGGTGRVVQAVHDVDGDRVTIVYPDANLCSDQAFRERFRAETDLLAGLDQPNLVPVRELVETETALAVITDPVEGATLAGVLATSGPLPPEAALAVLHATLLGLGAAHEAGVVHRDCQPGNVVIDAEGSVKITGFGLAVRTEPMMPAPGTPSYMAPELWEGAAPRSVTDLYAVTAIFYECLTGRVPYTAASVFELQTMHRAAPIPLGEVPVALAPLVTQGLAKTPVERPGDAAGFLAEVEAAAALEFGLEWEARGRRALAGLVAGALAVPAGLAVAGDAARAAGSGAAGAAGSMAGVGGGAAVAVAAGSGPAGSGPAGSGPAGSGAADSMAGVGGAAGSGAAGSVAGVGGAAAVADAASTSVLPVAGPPSAPAGGPIITPVADEGSWSASREGRGMGRGTKIGIGVAAVAVIGAVVAAVASGSGKQAAAAPGPSGLVVSPISNQTSATDDSGSPGAAAGARPTSPGASSGSASSPGAPTPAAPTAATSSSISGTTPPSTTATTPVGLPMPTFTPSLSFPPTSHPSAPPPTTRGTTPASSAPPPPTSAAVTVSATAAMTTSTYSGPCPPTANPPAGTVTFTVANLPAGQTVAISYHWHVVPAGAAGDAGAGIDGGNTTFPAHNGAATKQFTITDGQHSQNGLSGTVEVIWSAQGSDSGTATAGKVDITCATGGGPSSGGPTGGSTAGSSASRSG